MSSSSSGSQPYSRSLAPAPGEASTRAESTELDYLRRALWFEGHTAKFLSLTNPKPQEVAAYALERRQEWAPSTWRQTKAALAFRYTGMGTPDAMEACALLRDATQTPCVRKTSRTSGRRSKTVAKADFDAVIDRLKVSGSQYGPMLQTWLLLGAQIGLRPHEWGQCEVVRLSPSELGDEDATDDGPRPYLRVRNAKSTNGRSHGEHRHLNLSLVNPDLIEMVSEFAGLMGQVTEQGLYKRYYAAASKLLYRINRDLHKNDSHRWVQLYSPRHKFSAEAKYQLDREGVAALMGHATTKTAGQHYGRRVTATGSLGPRPVAAEIARVRKIRAYQARNVPSAPSTLPSPTTKRRGK